MLCAICTKNEVTSTKPGVDFCMWCWATGAHEERRLHERQVLGALQEAPGVALAYVMQTGGGCMVLCVKFDDGRFITTCHEDGPEIPGPEGPWGVAVSPTEEVWEEWDEERIELVPTTFDDAGLVAFVRERAAAA